MDKLKIFLFGLFLILPLSAIFASGASCDIAVSPSVVDFINDYSLNPGRVTVFGEGTGSFSDSTRVQINCNVDGTPPGANQNAVTARIPAYTQSVLAYTGYCTYKPSSTDVDYKVGVTILPDNTVCTAGLNTAATVKVKASIAAETPAPSQPAITLPCGGLNQAPCATCPAGSDCNARGCLAPYVGYIKSGVCVACPAGSTYDGFGSCINCGAEGRPQCSVPLPNGKKCEKDLVVDAQGKCAKPTQEPCGYEGQQPCSNGCYKPYAINNGKCMACEEGYAYSGGDGRVGLCLRCGGNGLYACGAPAPNGRICEQGLILNSDGRCGKPPASSPPQTDTGSQIEGASELGPERSIRYGLDWKWSLISVPYGEITKADHACLAKIFYYDKEAGKYMKVTDLKDKKLIGKGMWARKKTGNKVGDCTITYTGRPLVTQSISLKKGWNLIGIQIEGGIDTTKSSCKITGGPFMYSGWIASPNAKPQGYVKREYISQGTGYWIKVADSCTLSNEEEEEAPPPPPEDSSQSAQTIESQGRRGRRFVADAG